MKLVYPGPLAGVTINATGQTVLNGDAVEIADEALAADLVAQGWIEPQPVAAPKPKAVSKAATKEP